MKPTAKTYIQLSLFETRITPAESPQVHVSRGTVLSGVLNGTCSYETVPVLTDAPVSDSEPGIDYDPSNDQRLDRFDAVEMSISEIDDKVPTPSPSEGEKKE